MAAPWLITTSKRKGLCIKKKKSAKVVPKEALELLSAFLEFMWVLAKSKAQEGDATDSSKHDMRLTMSDELFDLLVGKGIDHIPPHKERFPN